MRDRDVDVAVAAADTELRAAYPGQRITVREVFDERGRVALWAIAGEGRVVVGVRCVEVMPVVWPWATGPAGVLGVWPSTAPVTVAALGDVLVEVA